MRLLQTAAALVATLALGGCFQSSTILRVKADRSGTLEQRTVFTGAALAQIRQFAQLGGPNAKMPDLLSEDQAKALATTIGPGVTYVSSTPIKTDTTEGRDSMYAFADINTLKISQRPPAPGGVTVRADSLGPPQEITFHLDRQANGSAVLKISMPDFKNLPGIPGAPAAGAPSTPPSEQQIAMVKQMLAGMRLTVAVEPDGHVVRTSSPYVDGNRVTLVDVDFDRLVADDSTVRKLTEAKTPADVQAAMKNVPGLKFTADREITIEFTPAK